MRRSTRSAAAPCQSTDKSVCATLILPRADWPPHNSIHDIDARRASVHGHVAEVARLFVEDDALPCREDELLEVAFDRKKLSAFVRKTHGDVARVIADVADRESRPA